MSGSDDNEPEAQPPAGNGKKLNSGRIQPGEIRNPNGRKGSKKSVGQPTQVGTATNDMIRRVASEQVTIQSGGKATKVTLVEANLKALGVRGAKGDVIAARSFVRLSQAADLREIEEQKMALKLAYCLKQDYAELSALLLKRGRPVYSPVLHPDHVIIDWETSAVTIGGTIASVTQVDNEVCGDPIANDKTHIATAQRDSSGCSSYALIVQALQHAVDEVREALEKENNAKGLAASTPEERKVMFAELIQKAVEKMDDAEARAKSLPPPSPSGNMR